jgi:hypothetical protein
MVEHFDALKPPTCSNQLETLAHPATEDFKQDSQSKENAG